MYEGAQRGGNAGADGSSISKRRVAMAGAAIATFSPFFRDDILGETQSSLSLISNQSQEGNEYDC
jgi:hypothetical protein